MDKYGFKMVLFQLGTEAFFEFLKFIDNDFRYILGRSLCVHIGSIGYLSIDSNFISFGLHSLQCLPPRPQAMSLCQSVCFTFLLLHWCRPRWSLKYMRLFYCHFQNL